MKNKQIKELVESWNWNLNIFEIYDELKENHPNKEDQRRIMKYCVDYYNESGGCSRESLESFTTISLNEDYTHKLIKDLSAHLGVDAN